MRNSLKEFLYFTRRERQGVLVLIIAIVFVLLLGRLYSHWQQQQSPTEADRQRHAISVKEYEAFAASIEQKEQQTKIRFTKQYRKQAPTIALAPFNPNVADSITFLQLGLPTWMAHNILRYRSKGGKFKRAEEFKKVYGLTQEQYRVLLPYIFIAHEDTAPNITHLYTPAAKDSTKLPFKYPAGTVISLNQADTTELKKIPGIGSGIARLIVGYRQQLGGFYCVEQLGEIKLDYQQLRAWLHVECKEIRLLPLNRIGVGRLSNHPYINFYQAKAFVEYRKKRGTIKSLKPFVLYEEFSEGDLERIGHYVSFD